MKIFSPPSGDDPDGGDGGGGPAAAGQQRADAHRQAREDQPPGTNCIKIGLPGKSILADYFQENRTSRRPFLLLRISFPRKIDSRRLFSRE